MLLLKTISTWFAMKQLPYMQTDYPVSNLIAHVVMLALPGTNNALHLEGDTGCLVLSWRLQHTVIGHQL